MATRTSVSHLITHPITVGLRIVYHNTLTRLYNANEPFIRIKNYVEDMPPGIMHLINSKQRSQCLYFTGQTINLNKSERPGYINRCIQRVSARQTEEHCQPPPGQTSIDPHVEIYGTPLKAVKNFTYCCI